MSFSYDVCVMILVSGIAISKIIKETSYPKPTIKPHMPHYDWGEPERAPHYQDFHVIDHSQKITDKNRRPYHDTVKLTA